jgi:hypothetical protein
VLYGLRIGRQVGQANLAAADMVRRGALVWHDGIFSRGLGASVFRIKSSTTPLSYLHHADHHGQAATRGILTLLSTTIYEYHLNHVQTVILVPISALIRTE